MRGLGQIQQRAVAERFVVGLCLLVALILRAQTIHWGLWLDEFETAWAVRGASLGEVWQRASLGSGLSQMPLNYAVVWITQIALGESEVGLRLPSLLASLVTLIVAHRLVRRACGARAAACVLLLLSVSPLVVNHGQWARAYALAELFTLLSVFGLARAVETGLPRHRLLAWGCGLLAVFSHKLTVTLILVLALTPLLLPKPRRYRRRALLFDIGLVAIAGSPVLMNLVRYQREGPLTSWFPDPTWWTISDAVFPEITWLLVAAAVGLVLGFRRPIRSAVPAARHLSLIALLLAATLIGFLGGVQLLGTRAFYAGYMGLASWGAVLLLPALLRRISPWFAAGLVLAAALVGLAHQNLAWRQEWREAAAELRVLAPLPTEPVVAWQGYVMSNRLIEPRASIPPEALSRMLAPIDLELGRPPLSPPRDYVLLPLRWTTRLGPYFDEELVPRLERCQRFYLVAHPEYAALFKGWVGRRFPDQFHVSYMSRVYRAPLMIWVFSRE